MTAAYLYFNAALYLLFAIWCTVDRVGTASELGYLSLSSGGRSEYLVVYGGLQLGLAIIFWLLARNAAHHRLGVLIALALYLPIVAYRVITIVASWPVGMTTQLTAVLEVALLLLALWCVRATRTTVRLAS